MAVRRTKIIITLGPATDQGNVLEELILAGANLVRINLSHGSLTEHQHRLQRVRELGQALDRHIGVIGDLLGPAISLQDFKTETVTLEAGQTLALDPALGATDGDARQVGITYPELASDLAVEDTLYLDSGRIQLKVTTLSGQRIVTRIIRGGRLQGYAGINRFGGGLNAPAITPLDRDGIQRAAELDVDYVAVSYPGQPEDIEEVRRLLRARNAQPEILAKIARAETVASDAALDAMIQAADAVMLARGDLGVEVGDASLIGIQKRVILRARQLDRAVITATQLMESMVDNPVPTRAEVFDVANAVLDGTDAVMCSSETARGRYPVETVRAMAEVCLGAETERSATHSHHRIDQEFRRTDETIAMAVMYAANHLRGVKAILSITESGGTPLWLSRISSGIPIFALTRDLQTARRVSLYRGVEAIGFDVTRLPINQINRSAVDELRKRDRVRDGDLVILCKGDHMGVHGGTNSLKIVSVGNIL